MSWTDEDEKQWQEFTKRREKNEKEVGKLHLIDMLQKLIKIIETDAKTPYNIDIDYVRGNSFRGYAGEAPVIGKRITVYFPFRDEYGNSSDFARE